jgi:hypothetical protein
MNRRRWLALLAALAGLLGLVAMNNAVTASVSSSSAFGTGANGVTWGTSYKNDVSPPLRDMPQIPLTAGKEREASANPAIRSAHSDVKDSVVQNFMAPLAMPAPILNFNGIPFPGVACNCAPPDTDGEVGATQYVQMVNEGYQVFNKSTGASLLGPNSIVSIWSGFGGVCQNNGDGDPVVLYDQLANRWLISQFAGVSVPTDECIAVSTTSDATGSYFRYGFHLGSNFFDYPHLGVWPDAYYMSMNVFNSSGTLFLGPQPFAFNRAAMLAGSPATFVSPVGPLGSTIDPFLPADLDGSILPTAGAPESFVQFPGAGAYTTYHFHVDFGTPANSTWGVFASPAAAGFTLLCPSTRSCVPEAGVTAGNFLDAIGDRLMFRLAYRKFGDGHESVVGNYTVNSGGVAGIRWFELRNVTAGPVSVAQESTYQPDTTWRWMGSAAMDQSGDLALGFSASSSAINPQIRYAGRLASDPINTLAQGEAHLFDGTGSQSGTSNRWGDYSDMTVDPVDDCTFWYTQEYYQTTGTFNWRTRIGNFKYPGCGGVPPTPTNTPVPVATSTPTNTSVPVATNTPTNTPIPNQPDFSITVSPSSNTVVRPGSVTYNVTLSSLNSFSGNVSLSVSGLPNKTAGTFSPPVVTLAPNGTGNSTLTITADRGGPTGTFTLTVTGTSGATSHSQDVTLIVTR